LSQADCARPPSRISAQLLVTRARCLTFTDPAFSRSDIHGWDPSFWQPAQFWSALTQGDAFTSDSADCVLVSALGTTLLPALALLAIRCGQVDDSEEGPKNGEGGGREGGEGLSAPLLESNGERRPLGEDIGDGVGAGSKLSQALRKEEDERREGMLQAGAAAGLTDAQQKERERLAAMREHERSLGEHKEVMNRQNSAMVALFIVASALQIYSGVKCIGVL
jgi:hypothetical protein